MLPRTLGQCLTFDYVCLFSVLVGLCQALLECVYCVHLLLHDCVLCVCVSLCVRMCLCVCVCVSTTVSRPHHMHTHAHRVFG